MYRVMIVDDEAIVRTNIKHMLDWKSLDCAVLALAENAEEAMRIFEEASPEIVITDVELKDYSGIQFIQQIKRSNKGTQVIVISQAADYRSVRGAMKAGAFDYLLKQTLRKETLKQVIEEAKPYCRIKRKRDKRYSAAADYLRHYLILVKNHLAIADDKIAALLQSSLFDPFRDTYELIYFRVDHINEYYQSHHEAHEEIRRHLQEMLESSIPDSHTYVISFITNHSGAILFKGCDRAMLIKTCHTIMRNITQCLSLPISITISDKNNQLSSLFKIFNSLLKQHEMRFYVGCDALIQLSEAAGFQTLTLESIDFHTRLLEAVNIRDFNEVRHIHQEIMTYAKEHLISPQNLLDYEIFILNNMEGNELNKGIKLSFSFQEGIHAIQHCETIAQLDELLLDVYERIEEWLKDERSNRYGKDITEIINFVENNYTQKITLKMLATHFGINESYLSRMFKNQTGKNLIYYVNEKKMHKARELLGNPHIMIKEAAYAVGYDDQFYFNKLFKRFFEVSPTEFRRRIQAQKQKENNK